jgi:class 3 adenylate cyclase
VTGSRERGVDASTLELAEHVVMFVDMVGAIQMKAASNDYRSSLPNVLSHNLEAIKTVTERLPQMTLPDGVRRITENDVAALKFIGDGAMILLPLGAEVHAVTIAAEILQALRAIRTGPSNGIHSCVGIAAGEVLIDRQTYARDVNHFGEPIDVASRLVDVAAPDQILLDEHVFAAICDQRFADHFGSYDRRACHPRPVRLFEKIERTIPIGMLANGTMEFETSAEREIRLDAKRHELRDRLGDLMMDRDTSLRWIRLGRNEDAWGDADEELTSEVGKKFEALKQAAEDPDFAAFTDLRLRLDTAYDHYQQWTAKWSDGEETLINRYDPDAQAALAKELDKQLRSVFQQVKYLAQHYTRLLSV